LRRSLGSDQIGNEVGEAIGPSLGPPALDDDVLTLGVAELAEALAESGQEIFAQGQQARVPSVGYLGSSSPSLEEIVLKQTQLAASALRLKLEPIVQVREIPELEQAFATISSARPDALIMIADRFVLAERARIVEFAEKRRLPTMYRYGEMVRDGVLMSYSPSYPDLFRRAAGYVDKILKGAKPVDLPVERVLRIRLDATENCGTLEQRRP